MEVSNLSSRKFASGHLRHTRPAPRQLSKEAFRTTIAGAALAHQVIESRYPVERGSALPA